MRNAMTLRGVLAAQENFKAYGAAHKASPIGFSIPLHSPEPRSLIYWRMPQVQLTPFRAFLFWQTKKGEQLSCSPFAGGFLLCGGYASAFAVTTKVVLAGMLLALPQNAPLLLA